MDYGLPNVLLLHCYPSTSHLSLLATLPTVVSAIQPKFDPLADFFTDHMLPAMLSDELSHGHAVAVRPSEVASDDVINGLFDSITYGKAASIIRQVRLRMAVDVNLPTDGFRRLLNSAA